MAYEENLQTISKQAGSDLSSRQYRFMTVNSSSQLAVAGAGVAVEGILQDKPDASGRAGSLGIAGVSKVEAGAAFTAGDDLTPDSVGRAVTAGTGDVVGATALEDASGAGSIVACLIKMQSEPVS